ncbi:MAG: pyridoxamine 5'-phosphate oxidase family protein [Candidatus Dormibacteria bacterium]
MTQVPGSLPEPVEQLLKSALVAELTHQGDGGQLYTDPLIPLWDGRHILMTSSILFSRKLERIKRNPKVSVSMSDPVACPGVARWRASIQGDARVIDGDIHSDWMTTLPLWEAKEPVVKKLFKLRFGLPLFWERSVIEITPRRVIHWRDGDTTAVPDVVEVAS